MQRAEAKMAVFDFIEGWYNPRWRHSSLGGNTTYQTNVSISR